MLEQLRQNKSSFIINFVIGLIVVVFIFWTGMPSSGPKPQFIASVNGTHIQEGDFIRAVSARLEQSGRFSRGKVPPSEEITIRQKVLDDLVYSELFKQEARRLGIVISDYELQQEILNNPMLKDENGKFDKERYKRILDRYPSFEQDERERLMLTRLEAAIRGMVQVSEADLKATFARQNTKINLEYLKVNSQAFESDIQISAEERTAFIKDNAADIQARYDQDFNTLYNSPKRVSARHILLKFESGDSDEVKAALRAKLEEIRTLASTSDFAELAKEYSEDPGSTARGGDLGFFDEKRMDPAFSAAAFSTPKGELSQLVETRFGVHLIKVEDIQEANVRTLEEVRDEIADKLFRERKAPELARQAVDKLKDAWVKNTPELEALMTQYKVSKAETGLTTRVGDNVRGIGTSAELAEEAFSLAVGSAPDKAYSIGEGFVLVRLKERAEADFAQFAAQKDGMKATALREKQEAFFNAWKESLKAAALIETGTAALTPAS
ncbi:MAG: SurA N-terminal domain-containing protein [Myxococcota bacterium]